MLQLKYMCNRKTHFHSSCSSKNNLTKNDGKTIAGLDDYNWNGCNWNSGSSIEKMSKAVQVQV